MEKGFGIDLGSYNTVCAYADDDHPQGEACFLENIGILVGDPAPGGMKVPVIPSMIHFLPNMEVLVGEEVKRNSKQSSATTIENFKKRIMEMDPTDWPVPPMPAHKPASLFLARLIHALESRHRINDDTQIVVTCPVDSYELYTNWLTGQMKGHLTREPKVLSEPVAAALGYGHHLEVRSNYLVVDFGAGTLDVALLRTESDNATRFKEIYKSGKNIGGYDIDDWVCKEIANHENFKGGFFDQNYQLIKRAACHLKEQLSREDKGRVEIDNVFTGGSESWECSRWEFEAILESNGLFNTLDKALEEVFEKAKRDAGWTRENVMAVFLVGGSCAIPSVQQFFLNAFPGANRVRFERPLDVVARGAAIYAAGLATSGMKDTLYHQYEYRYTDPDSTGPVGDKYWVIIPAGTKVPSPKSAPLTWTCSRGCDHIQVRFFENSPNGPEGHGRRPLTQNEVIEIRPPLRDDKIQVWFEVDENAHLLLTAQVLGAPKPFMDCRQVLRLPGGN